MKSSVQVRVRLGHFDYAHPSDTQTSVYAEILNVARAHYLLPAHFHDSLRDKEWGEVLDTAHSYFESSGWVSDSATTQARADLRAWLAVDENRDALNEAWFNDRAQKDPVSRSLQRDKERLQARVDEVERAYTFDTAELKRRIAELEAERHTTNEALADVTVAQRAAEAVADGITHRFAPTQALHEQPAQAEDVTPQVQKLRNLLAGQRAAQGEHYAAVHHTYRVPRDLPEMGGSR
ncbi:hypothetical protein [Streptomyces sp. NPDC004008]